LASFFKTAVELISDLFPMLMLILCGIYLSFKGDFFQITRFFDSVKLFGKAFKSKKKNEFSSFKAACTSLSAAVGTGNIAGVAGAVSIGGAGAVFWMWISAVLGMALKAIEITLAVKFRERQKDKFIGGPMYYIKNGLSEKFKPLAYLFCLAGIPSVFCTGNITQTNAAVSSITDNSTLRFIIGLIFALLTYAVTAGGLDRIGDFTEKIVPFMSVLYIVLCGTVVILNIDFLPIAFKMIIKGAFNPKAVTGGAVGSVLTAALIGAERGIFSNEAGLGTAGIAHSCATDADAKFQGLFGIFEVFTDTILLCTLTALTLICSGVSINYGAPATSRLVINAVATVFSNAAAPIISVMLCLFAFSSIVGWAAYGTVFADFFCRNKYSRLFLYVYPVGCIVGAVSSTEFSWDIAAFFNGIMLLINLPILVLLNEQALIILKKRKKDVRKKSKLNK